MKTNKIILIIVSILGIVSNVNAEETVWQNIRHYLLEDDAHPSAEGPAGAKGYLASLTAEQLLDAAIECSKEMEEKTKVEDWDVAGITLGFFYEYYPQKTDNLKDISPLLKDLEDKKQSPFLRHCIMHLLGGGWRDNLDIHNRIVASSKMIAIFSDPCEPEVLKAKAVRMSAILLPGAYKLNLKNDPNVKNFIEQTPKGSQNYLQAVRSGQVNLSKEVADTEKEILRMIDDSAEKCIGLFSDKSGGVKLKEETIFALTRYSEISSNPSVISQTLSNAVEHYKDYDETLWHYLIKTNIESFGNRTAESKLPEMINAAKDNTNKEHLIYLNKILKKEAEK